MKKNIIKLIALGVSVIMTTSVMAVSVNTTSWSLRYTPMAPSSDNRTSVYAVVNAGTSFITAFKEECTSHSVSALSDGSVPYARYWTYTTNRSGETIAGSGSYYHYNKQSLHYININGIVHDGQTLHVRYELENGTAYASIYGNYYYER